MKKFLLFCLIFVLLLSLFGCKKGLSMGGGSGDKVQYVKEYGTYVYKNEEDCGKSSKEVNDKEYLEFGSKLNVLKSKNVEGKEYLKVQLPDKSEYWANKENLTEKFIVITQNNVEAYDQPDDSYKTGIKLQPGDYGLFVKEQDGWTNVEFYAYRPDKEDGERKWVGNKWIKGGYTDDLNAAREAYRLYLAYYYKISKNDTDKAVKYLEEGLEINKGDKSEIYSALEDYAEELEY